MSLSAPSAPKADSPLVTEDAFALASKHTATLPAWWNELRSAAWEKTQSLPLPRRTDELWRFSDMQALRFAEPFAPAQAPDAATSQLLLAQSQRVAKRAGQLVFVNDTLVQHEPLAPALAAQGVVFESLETALQKHGDRIRHFILSQQNKFASEKFTSLHAALTRAGVVLIIPSGVEITEPFVVHHWASGPRAAIFPHTLVIAEENAKATLVEFRDSAAPESTHFSVGAKDIHVGAAAQFTYISSQNFSRTSTAYQAGEVLVQRDGRANTFSLQLGGKMIRHESHSRLQGPGAHSEMLSLAVAHQGQLFDQRTLQTHQAPRTSSNLLFKNALFETARTIFSGLIVVEPDAQKTDAYQSNRNLLCSSEAEANSLPGLEIQANDVRCTHGSTASKVDDEHLFYFAARGISPEAARRLLVFGFFEEVLGKVEDQALHDLLRAQIESTFA